MHYGAEKLLSDHRMQIICEELVEITVERQYRMEYFVLEESG